MHGARVFPSLPHCFGVRVMTQEQRLAQRIRDRAKELGLTHLDLADRLTDNRWPELMNTEATEQLVQKVLQGPAKRRLKGIEPRLFAHALEVDPDWLMHGLGMPGEDVTIKGVTAIAHARGTPPQ